jgi:hypothetical protein
MSENYQSKPVKTTHRIRRFILYVAQLLIAFLLGFVPMWLKFHECSVGFPEAKRQLSLARILNSLASAVIEARRGDYEPARQAASDFFTSLRAEANAGANSALSQAEKEGVQVLFTQRDELVTLLARGDAASVDRLSDMYVAYSRIMSG